MNFVTYFTYKAVLNKIVDADTLDATLDLGFSVFKKVRCRLAGINAPELSTPEGKIAKQFLIETLPLNSEITVESKGYDKYGRSIAVIYFNGESINKKLLDTGHAVPYI
ncbi:MAG: nuclease [Erysipelotrichaceae bacterium]|nr:nuclease [Erysipelotrichaceae bacterium]